MLSSGILSRVALALLIFSAFGCGSADSAERSQREGLGWLAALWQPAIPAGLQIRHAYQINLEIIDRLGAFFYRSRSPSIPALDQVRSAALVQLAGESRHRFVLLGRNGVLVFSTEPGRMRAQRIPAAVRARDLAINSGGRIAFVTADGSLDFCHTFTGDEITSRGNCTAVPGAYESVSAASSGFLGVGPAGIDLHSPDGQREQLLEGSFVAAVVLEERVYAVAQGGQSVSVYQRSGRRYVLGQYLAGVRIPLDDGLSGLVPVMDIAVLAANRIAVLSQTHNCLIILDAELQPISFLRFPPLPRPLRRLDFVRGLAAVSGTDTFGVYNLDALSVFTSAVADGHSIWAEIPKELHPSAQVLATLDADDFDPAEDLLAHPKVARALREAHDSLNALESLDTEVVR